MADLDTYDADQRTYEGTYDLPLRLHGKDGAASAATRCRLVLVSELPHGFVAPCHHTSSNKQPRDNA